MVVKIRFYFFLVPVLLCSILACSQDRKDHRSAFYEASVQRLVTKLQAIPEDLNTVLALNAWIYSSLDARRSNSPNVERVEDALFYFIGPCGIRDLLLQDVLQKIGFQTRRVSFYDVPIQIGHTATEVLVDSKWIFLDSSFGIYFTHKDNPDAPLSLEEIRAFYPNIQMYRSQLPGWQQTWTPMTKIAAEIKQGGLYQPYYSNNFYDSLYDDTIVAYATETYIQSQYSTLDNPDVAFTLHVNLDSTPSGYFGKVDSSTEDLLHYHYTDGETISYHPLLWLLGYIYDPISNGALNVSNSFSFRTSDEKSINLYIHLIPNSDDSEISRLKVTATNGVVSNIESGDNYLKITLTSHPPTTTLLVATDEQYTRLTLDAISWSP